MAYQSEPLTMWFGRRLVLRESPIHGLGTFSTDDIEAGSLLMMVTGGLVVRPEDRQSGHLALASDMYNEETLAENVWILTAKAFHYYINHSCEPTAVDLSRPAGATQYVALRTVRAGEEVAPITMMRRPSSAATATRRAADGRRRGEGASLHPPRMRDRWP